MKKILSLTVAAALAMGFAACSNEEDLTVPQTNDEGAGAYMQFVVSLPASANSRSNETSDVYVTGTEDEYKVEDVYVYFAKPDGNLVEVRDGQYYAEYTAKATDAVAVEEDTANKYTQSYKTEVERMTENVDAALKAAQADGNCLKVYLLCNQPVENVTTVDALLEATFDYTNAGATTAAIKKSGMPMTARSISGLIYDELDATADNNILNPWQLSFEVERSLARIAYVGKSNIVDLYDFAHDPDAADGTNNGTSQASKIGEIEILKYYVVNKTNKYYAYRHVGLLTATEAGMDATPAEGDITITKGTGDDAKTYTVPAKFGPLGDTGANSYLLDPNSGNKTSKTTSYAGYWNGYSYAYAHYTQFKNFTASTDGSTPGWIEYVAENGLEKDAQTKNQATGIFFQVKIRPQKVVEINDEGNAEVVTYSNADGNVYSGDLYYYDRQFFASEEALAAWEGIEVENLAKDYKHYTQGYAYYEYFIRHNNNNKYSEMANMEFAIVRNNSYELDITSAAMSPYQSIKPENPGTDDPNNGSDDPEDEPDPDPQTPGNDDPDPDYPDPTDPEPVEEANMYMQVNVSVRPWIIRSNSVILGQ